MREPDIAAMGEQERSYWWHVCRRLIWRTILNKWLPASYCHPGLDPGSGQKNKSGKAVFYGLDSRLRGNDKREDGNDKREDGNRGDAEIATGYRPRNDEKENIQILDVGCGGGFNLEFLKQWGKVTGIDQSDTALLFAKQHGAVEKGDVLTLPRPDGSVDLITAFDVLEHLPDDTRALIEWRRVLKVGGAVAISVPAYQWLYGPHDQVLLHQRRYTLRRLFNKLDQAGFRPIFSTYVFMFTFPIFVAQRLLTKSVRQGAGYNSAPLIINQLLIGLGHLEALLIKFISLPFGSSVFILARKV